MTDTARLALPLLDAGQAQKEVWHNAALARLDQLVQASVAGWGAAAPPSAPLAGETRVVGPAPTGAWAGQAGALATWSDGGWRFCPPVEGMAAWSAADGAVLRHVDGQWRLDPVRSDGLVVAGEQVVASRAAAIPAPAGGATVDAEARATLTTVLTALRHHGLIAP